MHERFLVTDNVPEGFIEALEAAGYTAEHIPTISNDDLALTIGQYTGLVVNTAMRLDRPMLSLATRLKYILRPGSGLDNIDLAACADMGIQVFSSPEGNRDAVGEHAMALLLNLMTYIPRAWEQVKAGKWVRHANTGVELKGKTVGIIGFGHTGSAFGEKLRGFGCEILVYDKYRQNFGLDYIQEVSLAELQLRADAVSVHVPLTPETHHMLNREFLNGFAKNIYLVNAARGPIGDTEALAEAVESGKLSGLALDVLENERLDTYTIQEQQLLQRLVRAGNVIITPHIGGWTEEARRKIFFIVLDKFREAIKS